jgi:hypothetical protein
MTYGGVYLDETSRACEVERWLRNCRPGTRLRQCNKCVMSPSMESLCSDKIVWADNRGHRYEACRGRSGSSLAKSTKPDLAVLRSSCRAGKAEKRWGLQIHRFIAIPKAVQSEMTLAKRPLQPRAGVAQTLRTSPLEEVGPLGDRPGASTNRRSVRACVLHELGSFPRANTHFVPSVWLPLFQKPQGSWQPRDPGDRPAIPRPQCCLVTS